jgi:hypothetical protein
MLRFLAGLVLALVFAGAAVSALGITWVTVKDAIYSRGSLETFEAHIRHYSDRLETTEQGLLLHRAEHPFVLHFGMLGAAWLLTLGSATALNRLQKWQDPRTRNRQEAQRT